MAGHSGVIRRRARVALAAVTLLAGALVARFAYLQIWEAGSLSALANAQRTKTIDLSAVRGEILDANGRALAVSVEAYSIYAMPREAKAFDPAATARALAPALKKPASEIEKGLSGKYFRWVARKVDPALKDAVKALKLPGIGIVKETRRDYPKQELAATLIGFVGVDNQGLAGIEHAFDAVLRGPKNKLAIQVDAYGREILREGNHSPVETLLVDGNQVVLTIDENLQHIAERELALAVEQSGAKRGAVVLMEPATGNLLAFAVLPTYNPNRFGAYGWESIKNWVVTDQYEPGSTMKIFSIAAALEAGRISPDQVFVCPPSIKVSGRIVSDHDATGETRRLTPFQIMEVSSNVGTTRIAQTLSAAEHRAFLRRMGFGSLTGSGITGEVPGVLPLLPWREITHATISYGQGVTTTALQIVSAASAIGNQGVRMRPRLIDKVVSAKGETLQAFEPQVLGQVLKPETSAQVLAMLEQVVETGTGTSAGVPGYRIAGKTGTAQKVKEDGTGYSSDVIASFLGFFPAPNPQFVMLTLLDAPQKIHWASATASPLFGRVAGEVLRHRAIRPTEPKTLPKAPGVTL